MGLPWKYFCQRQPMYHIVSNLIFFSSFFFFCTYNFGAWTNSISITAGLVGPSKRPSNMATSAQALASAPTITAETGLTVYSLPDA